MLSVVWFVFVISSLGRKGGHSKGTGGESVSYFGVRSGIILSSVHQIPKTTSCKSYLGISFSDFESEMEVPYEELELEQLRLECASRDIEFGSKDGRRNLARATAYDELDHCNADSIVQDDEPSRVFNPRNDELLVASNVKDSDLVNALSFKQQIELLQLQREMRREEEERQIRDSERHMRCKKE